MDKIPADRKINRADDDDDDSKDKQFMVNLSRKAKIFHV